METWRRVPESEGGIPKLYIRGYPSGRKSYYFRDHDKRIILGYTDEISLDEAIKKINTMTGLCSKYRNRKIDEVIENQQNTEEEKYNKVLELLSGSIDPPVRSPSIKSLVSKQTDMIPVILWSDWHIGETIKPEETFGFNKFDEKEAEKRVKTLISKSISLIQHETQADKVTLWLGGDFVSGWLHEDHLISDWCSPLEAIHWVCEHLYNMILDLLSEFNEISIWCSPGNHGRLFKKPVTKKTTSTSYDWLIYAQLKSWLGQQEGLDFNIPTEGDCLVKVNNKTLFMTHGNSIGASGGGSAEIGFIGPITRGRNRIARSLSSMGIKFDTMVLGHYHQNIWMPSNGIIVNPAFCGYGEYAKTLRLPAERPAQLLFFSHKEHGLILPMEIFL